MVEPSTTEAVTTEGVKPSHAMEASVEAGTSHSMEAWPAHPVEAAHTMKSTHAVEATPHTVEATAYPVEAAAEAAADELKGAGWAVRWPLRQHGRVETAVARAGRRANVGSVYDPGESRGAA